MWLGAMIMIQTKYNITDAGFHLVEETGLNPGLNRPGRNRFIPPEVDGRNWKKLEKSLKCLIK